MIFAKSGQTWFLLEGVEDARINIGRNTSTLNWQSRIFCYTRTRTCKYDSKDPHKLLGQRLVVESGNIHVWRFSVIMGKSVGFFNGYVNVLWRLHALMLYPEARLGQRVIL